ETINLFGKEFKSSGIYDAITNIEEKSTDSVIKSIKAPEKIATQKVIKSEMDTMPKSILFIGDSMLEGLGARMAAYAKENGHKLHNVIWYSSTSKTWGSCDTLKYFIRKFKPNFIIVSLGANELFVKNITSKRHQNVKRILFQIKEIPYVWIGPPNWKEDTGINDLIASLAKPGTFFLSKGMHFDRSKDGAHPTRLSSALWMDSVARWIKLHSAYPIKLSEPKVKTARANSTTILQPTR
ncbi:MAG: SGNH/GDSL hydrolase family protein, partial [Muribaculaceae bacterium]